MLYYSYGQIIIMHADRVGYTHEIVAIDGAPWAASDETDASFKAVPLDKSLMIDLGPDDWHDRCGQRYAGTVDWVTAREFAGTIKWATSGDPDYPF